MRPSHALVATVNRIVIETAMYSVFMGVQNFSGRIMA